ncbi:MAG: NADH-quinone oxidoreductase subunit C [Fimbriiglobus sp.]
MPYLKTLQEKFADGFTAAAFRDNNRVILKDPASVFAVMSCLKNDCGFDMLAELTAVDYLGYPDARDRYAVVYGLTNTSTGERVWVKVMLNDPDPAVASVFPLWGGANWMEREAFDMYGVRFDGHPDLRRILMPPEFAAFPLRKDYPMRGRGERHNVPTITRAES